MTAYTLNARNLACAALCTLSLAPAQEDQTPPLEGLAVSAGEHDFYELAKSVAERTGYRLVAKRREFLRAGGGGEMLQVATDLHITPESALRDLSVLMFENGLALTPLDWDRKLFDVVNMRGSRRSEIAANATWVEPDRLSLWRGVKMSIYTTLRVGKHVPAHRLVSKLRPDLIQWRRQASFLTLGCVRSDMLLLQGYPDQIEDAVRRIVALDVPEPVPPPDAEPLRLDAGAHTFVDVVRAFAERFGFTIRFDPAESKVAGSNSITLPTPLEIDATPDGLHVLSNLLHHGEFALVPRNWAGRELEVIQARGKRRAEIAEHAVTVKLAEVATWASSRIRIRTEVPFDHLAAQTAVTTMRPFLAMPGRIAPVVIGADGAASIQLEGSGRDVAVMVELLKSQDAPLPGQGK